MIEDQPKRSAVDPFKWVPHVILSVMARKDHKPDEYTVIGTGITVQDMKENQQWIASTVAVEVEDER